jgi:hypothetical protein
LGVFVRKDVGRGGNHPLQATPVDFIHPRKWMGPA